MKVLTKKQDNILRFIKDVVSKNGTPPTIIEIRDHFQFKAVGTVQDHLEALKEKGYIKKTKKARSIEVLGFKKSGSLSIPIVGEVAAGEPVFAEDNIEGYLSIDREWIKDEKDKFLLRVKGDSMIDAGIFDQDYVLVKKASEAAIGDIVVGMIGKEATVKYFAKDKSGRICFKPANKRYKPILLDNDSSVIGKVLMVIRRYV